MRIGVLAGEASGDILGARLLAALHTRCPGLVVEGIGGPLMEAQGLRSMVPMERLSVMGFVEPLQRLPELLRIRRSVHDHFVANPPDLFLGIDSPTSICNWAAPAPPRDCHRAPGEPRSGPGDRAGCGESGARWT